MTRLLCRLSLVLLPITAAVHADEPAASTAEQQALATLDEFMEAFNSADAGRWAETLNYPHVRVAAGTVRIWQNADEYADQFRFDEFRRRTGWHHSEWDEERVSQSSKDKAHIAVTFTRYRADGSKIASYRSLYIVTNQGGHWGVQARSSFAP